MGSCEEIIYLAIIAIISLLSKIPFISINMLLPFPEFLVWMCVVANMISWFLLEVWALGLDAAFFIKESKINTLQGFLSAIVVITLAIISQIPNVFPAIQYNPKEYQVYIAICVLLALSFFPIKSLILTFRWVYRHFYLSKEENKRLDDIVKLKSYYMSLDLSSKRKIPFIENDKITSNQLTTINDKGKSIFNVINCGTILGCFTVVCYEWFNAEYSYTKWNEFISNDSYSAYILSILVVITTFYLTGMSVINMFTNLFRLNLRYEFQTFYLQYIIVQILICLSSILSVGVYYVVVLEFYHNNYNKSILLTVCCCTTIFMILETGSFAMVNYFFNHLLSIYGTDDDKELIKLNKQIKNLTIIDTPSVETVQIV